MPPKIRSEVHVSKEMKEALITEAALHQVELKRIVSPKEIAEIALKIGLKVIKEERERRQAKPKPTAAPTSIKVDPLGSSPAYKCPFPACHGRGFSRKQDLNHHLTCMHREEGMLDGKP